MTILQMLCHIKACNVKDGCQKCVTSICQMKCLQIGSAWSIVFRHANTRTSDIDTLKNELSRSISKVIVKPGSRNLLKLIMSWFCELYWNFKRKKWNQNKSWCFAYLVTLQRIFSETEEGDGSLHRIHNWKPLFNLTKLVSLR